MKKNNKNDYIEFPAVTIAVIKFYLKPLVMNLSFGSTFLKIGHCRTKKKPVIFLEELAFRLPVSEQQGKGCIQVLYFNNTLMQPLTNQI
ncbi:hypothetical protein [Calidifontibacillus erzurumensis]|uniref:hypothetical protein n=1 Tax=Calidifontibacillus erzurumensis TaxID=2741433 RepID=UPI0035B52C67